MRKRHIKHIKIRNKNVREEIKHCKITLTIDHATKKSILFLVHLTENCNVNVKLNSMINLYLLFEIQIKNYL